MRALGLRSDKDSVQWVVVEGTRAQPTLVARGRCVAPKNSTDLDALKFLRNKVLDEAKRLDVSSVGVRRVEGNARAKHALFPRIRAEGVFVELALREGWAVDLFVWSTIASRLGAESSKDDYAEADTFRGIDVGSWELTTVERPKAREALYAAVAALKDES